MVLPLDDNFQAKSVDMRPNPSGSEGSASRVDVDTDILIYGSDGDTPARKRVRFEEYP